jgi:hypothetical protein
MGGVGVGGVYLLLLACMRLAVPIQSLHDDDDDDDDYVIGNMMMMMMMITCI